MGLQVGLEMWLGGSHAVWGQCTFCMDKTEAATRRNRLQYGEGSLSLSKLNSEILGFYTLASVQGGSLHWASRHWSVYWGIFVGASQCIGLSTVGVYALEVLCGGQSAGS